MSTHRLNINLSQLCKPSSLETLSWGTKIDLNITIKIPLNSALIRRHCQYRQIIVFGQLIEGKASVTVVHGPAIPDLIISSKFVNSPKHVAYLSDFPKVSTTPPIPPVTTALILFSDFNDKIRISIPENLVPYGDYRPYIEIFFHFLLINTIFRFFLVLNRFLCFHKKRKIIWGWTNRVSAGLCRCEGLGKSNHDANKIRCLSVTFTGTHTTIKTLRISYSVYMIGRDFFKDLLIKSSQRWWGCFYRRCEIDRFKTDFTVV